jgi:hypothetical protein
MPTLWRKECKVMVQNSALGLVVTPLTCIRKTRLLPVSGEVRVSKGQQVEPETTVAYAEVPGYPVPINVASRLGVEPQDIERLMLRKEGDVVQEKEVIARKRHFLWLADDLVLAPIDGTVQSISLLTGMVVLRSHPVPVEAKAFISGEVVDIIEKEGVVIETEAALIQGVFGIGGENHGSVHVAVDSPADVLDESLLTPEMKGKIVVGGRLVTLGAVKKALRLGVHGLIAGGLHDKDLSSFLGYDIGLAVTGQELFGLSLIVTEGFGEVPMRERTFNLFKDLEGEMASINGATHIRAGVKRPEVIVSRPVGSAQILSDGGTPAELSVGSQVRIIRYPFFGQEGRVVDILECGDLPSEVGTSVAVLKLGDGQRVNIPLVNLEQI